MSTRLESGAKIREIDWLLVVLTLAIAFGGVLAIDSAVHLQPKLALATHKQLVGVFIGLALMLAIGFCDYSALLPRLAKWLYAFNLILLAVVAKLGHSSHGAQRWIPLGPIEFQPSEVAKLLLIVCLAVWVADRRRSIRELRTVLGSVFYVLIPTLLILAQPDLGTALVIISLWLGILTIAGARWQHLVCILLAGITIFSVMWRCHILIKPYQKTRLVAFVNPSADPQDTGYHLRQSQIAIGSGQLTGEGYEHGSQANGHFIPEQHTDFIFTIVGEEGGFVTSAILLGLYLILLERGVMVLVRSEDYMGRLLAAGVLSVLAFHIVVNVGMTIGVMPVTGVPLPFFSYGLSALLIDMAAVGLLVSVAARERRSMF